MSFSIPSPRANEAFTVDTLAPQIWYHIYCTETHPVKADAFNEGWGQTRFAPVKSPAGADVHTYYAASSIRCAMMESILHDVPLRTPSPFRVSRLKHFHLATIGLTNPLQAVSFHSPFLPALALDTTRLIESLPAYYKQTSKWSEAAYAQVTSAAAIMYGSRRDDAGRCIMLFKNRLPHPAHPFEILGDEPMAGTALSREFLTLIQQLRIPQSP